MYAICKIQTIGQPTPQVETVRINIGRKKKSDQPAFHRVPNRDALDRLFCNGKDTRKAGYSIVFYQLFSNETDTKPYNRMSYHHWRDTYEALEDAHGSLITVDYAEAHAIANDPERSKCLWTELDCGGSIVITNGWHFVNRMDYYLTAKPIEDDMELEVYDEPEPSMVDDINGGYSTLIYKSNGLVVEELDGEEDNFLKAIRRIAKKHDIELNRYERDIDELHSEFEEQCGGMGIEIELY